MVPVSLAGAYHAGTMEEPLLLCCIGEIIDPVEDGWQAIPRFLRFIPRFGIIMSEKASTTLCFDASQ